MKFRITKVSSDNYSIEQLDPLFGLHKPLISWDHELIKSKIKNMEIGEYYDVQI